MQSRDDDLVLVYQNRNDGTTALLGLNGYVEYIPIKLRAAPRSYHYGALSKAREALKADAFEFIGIDE